MAALTQRRLAPEHMDDPAALREDLAEALRFIRLVNARLGGTRAAVGQFQRWSRAWNRGETIRIIDIGTGSADIPLALAAWARSAGFTVYITAVDLHPVTIDLARQHVGERSDISIMLADALKLTELFQPQSFHYAHAGMFLHHLSDVQVMTVLRIMDRLTTRGLIWNDLIRSRFGKLGARLLTLGLPAHVKHDATVSVDAGFTRSEALDLARRAGLANSRWRNHLLHRFTLVSEKAEN
jgi:hypothetical protein